MLAISQLGESTGFRLLNQQSVTQIMLNLNGSSDISGCFSSCYSFQVTPSYVLDGESIIDFGCDVLTVMFLGISRKSYTHQHLGTS
jgi:hypothetical protein